jgi:hypothetical protein
MLVEHKAYQRTASRVVLVTTYGGVTAAMVATKCDETLASNERADRRREQ